MRTIGQIKPEVFYDFKMQMNTKTQEWEVKSNKDNFTWATGKTTKGAIISACNQGIRLRDIDISQGYVPIKEVIKAIKD